MSASQKKYFSGDTLRQALVQAANHFQLAPEEIAYRPIEKRHGFIKARRKFLIEVDSEAPRRTGPTPPAPAAPPAAPVAPAPRPAAPPPLALPAVPLPPLPEAAARPSLEARPAPPRPERAERRPPRPAHPAPATAEPRLPSRSEPARLRPVDEEAIVTLPERPRSASERFPAATGPVAEAAQKGLTLLLGIAGLALSPKILQGEGRLEIELSGSDTDRCFEEEGEILRSIEHLLPRVIRSLSGDAVPCRVDCDNFHDIREEQLRTLAQRVAAEVRKRGRYRTLEPMNPADRRVIHMTLADDPGVVTESEGEGYFKRVTIRPA
ncbi:MAG TPA: R3H domain-containing nucleic acid-binding protein [Thermoanaerobaculia bacterium]|nr:R3H domain-containing nucleic acid-binding protein [Thermoanaerobaculia bacterium]